MSNLETMLRDILKQETGRTDEQIDAMVEVEKKRYERMNPWPKRVRDTNAVDAPPVCSRGTKLTLSSG